MPGRTRSQQIGSLAEAEIRRIWNAVDAAVDDFREDFGEDLLVQSCLKGEMDKSRIWIQVKGTDRSLKCRSGGAFVPPPVDIKRGLLARWVGTADPVVLVRWHVSKRIGWYCIIQHSFSEDDIWGKDPNESVRIKFSPDCRFDEESAKAIEWVARLSSSSARVSKLRADQAVYIGDEEEALAKLNTAVLSVATDIMTKLGMLDRRAEGLGLSKEIRDSIVEIFLMFGEQGKLRKDDSLKRAWKAIVFLAHLEFMRNKFPDNLMLQAVPGPLLVEMHNITNILLDREGINPAMMVSMAAPR